MLSPDIKYILPIFAVFGSFSLISYVYVGETIGSAVSFSADQRYAGGMQVFLYQDGGIVAAPYKRCSGNSVIRDKGVCDPHIHIFNNRAYLYAGVDDNWNNIGYVMKEWQIWSSSNLIDWRYEWSLRPENTYIGPSAACWASDAVERDGKYYWYFSNGTQDIGVAMADRPEGPFEDALGAPLIYAASAPDIQVYDPDIFIDEETNQPYILFGGHGYQIARLDLDMLSLAEEPRELVVLGAPYYGDKIEMFKRKGIYYMQWGPYAVSDNIYGPYQYKGLYTDGHSKIFTWNNQWFAGKVEKDSQFYRSTSINYVLFKDDGAVRYIENDPMGVGQYDGLRRHIPFAYYFASSHPDCIRESSEETGFEIAGLPDGGWLNFPNLYNVPDSNVLYFRYQNRGTTPVKLRINLVTVSLPPSGAYQTAKVVLPHKSDDLDFKLEGHDAENVSLVWFSFNPEGPEEAFPGKRWDFDLSSNGWTSNSDTTIEWDQRSAIQGEILGKQPTIFCPIYSNTDLDVHKILFIRLRTTESVHSVRVWWDVYGENPFEKPESTWSKQNSLLFCVKNHQLGYVDYLLDLSNTTNWSGLLKQMRLDFITENSHGHWELECVSLLPPFPQAAR